MTTLPVNIDTTYADRDAADKLHQQHHDALHAFYNVFFNVASVAAGDLFYVSAASGGVPTAMARLAKGSARQQLAMNSAATAPEWVASLASLLTAQGDIIYASAANTPARLPKGTAGQRLRMNSGATAPEWAPTVYSSVVRRSAVQSINNATDTSIAWDAEVSDVGGFHDNSSDNTRLTVPTGVSGVAMLRANGRFAGDADGYRQIWIRKNGTTILSTTTLTPAATTFNMDMEVTAFDPTAVATDYYEVRVHHTAGAALDFGGTTQDLCSFGITVM